MPAIAAPSSKTDRNVIVPALRSEPACHANQTERHRERTLSVAPSVTLLPGSKSCARRTAHCARSTLEAHLQPVLAELRIVKRSKGGRRDVRLNIGRQERVEGIVGAHADPRPQLADLEPVFEPEIELEIVGHPLIVAGADEIER